MPKDENQSIKILQDELIELSEIEERMKTTDGRNPVQKVVNGYAATKSLYTNPFKMQAMINELKIVLKTYSENGAEKGRTLGRKALSKFLDESEKRDIAQALSDTTKLEPEVISRKRLRVSFMELQKEAGILKADIQIFKANAKLARFSNKDILNQLVIAGKDKEGMAQGFAKRVKQVNVQAMRRQKSIAEIGQYKLQAKENEKWQWIAISVKPCPDCDARAGKVMKFEEWEKMGLPGMGRTVCRGACKCKLYPLSISEDMFPTVKVFDWDPKKQVLTTASEARKLKALKNQPPQKTKL